MSFMNVISDETVHLISVPTPRQLQRVLVCLLDEKEFLSPFGIRSLSKYHEENPYEIKAHNLMHYIHTFDYISVCR